MRNGRDREDRGAQYEISIDGVPRTYRDRQDIALQTARFLKSRNPTAWSSSRTWRSWCSLSRGPFGMYVFKPETLEWHAGATLATWAMTSSSDAHRPRVSALVLGAART